MCRLLFVKSENKFEIEHYLKIFAELCKSSKEYQGHGWGCSYLVDGQWVHYHNISPIWKDNLTQFKSTKHLTVHARSAFHDKGIFVENNMPFYDEKYIFTFNGELQGVKIKSEGRIGAEKIFNFIKRFDKGNITGAIEKGVSIIKKRTEYLRAMNIIITSKEGTVLSSNFNEDPGYFQMSKKIAGDTTVLSSVAFPNEEGWQKIENNSIGVY